MSVARLCTVVLAGALVAASTGCVSRQPERPTVVVLEVKGARDPGWEKHVAELVEARRYSVIPADRYWLTADRLGAKPLIARNVARVAEALGATAVVHGRMTTTGRRKKSRRQVVTLYVRKGTNGRVIEKHRLLVRRGAAVPRSEAALERRLLASLPPPPPDVQGPPAPHEPTKPTATATAVASTPPATAKTPPPAAKTPPPAAKTPPPAAKPAPATAKTAPSKRPPRDEPKESRTARRSDTPRRGVIAEPAAPPAERAPPVVYDPSGQAVDDELPPSR